MHNIEKFTIKPLSEVNINDWNSFVEINSKGWLWHTYDFLKAYAKWNSHEDISFAILEDTSIRSIVPLTLSRSKILKFFPYNYIHSLGGPLFDQNLSPKQLKAVNEKFSIILGGIVNQYNAAYLNISTSPQSPFYRDLDNALINPLKKQGYKTEANYTWWIDTTSHSSEELWKNISKGHKSAIKTAMGANILVRPAQPNECSKYYELHKLTMQRSNLPPHPLEYFDYYFSCINNNKSSYILFAESENQVIAAVIFAFYKNALLYVSGVSNEQASKNGAMHLLVWNAMKLGIDNKVSFMDLGKAILSTTNSKLKGINTFKKNFGPKLFPLHEGKKDFRGKLIKCYHLLRENNE